MRSGCDETARADDPGATVATPPEDGAAQARRHCAAAFRVMQEHGVAPTPQNYTVWYAYASGANAEIRRLIDDLIAAGRPFTSEIAAELYARLVTDGQPLELLAGAHHGLDRLVRDIRRHIEDASATAGSFGDALAAFTSALGSGGDVARARGLISGLLGETQRMAERNRTLEERLSKSASEVEELRQNLEAVRREALTDPLTGIPNRKHFDARLREAARDAMEGGEPLSLLIADIDHFKRFNDTYGHPVGDQVLRLVARTLTHSVKGRDTPARYGGEEFAVILPQTPLRGAAAVGEQIRVAIMRGRIVGKASRQAYGTVTLSLGAAQYRPGETLDDLVRRADAALYQAKRTGRNRLATEAMLEAPPG
jgi:diguanylate cyclase